jgi:hypothetical protein
MSSSFSVASMNTSLSSGGQVPTDAEIVHVGTGWTFAGNLPALDGTSVV